MQKASSSSGKKIYCVFNGGERVDEVELKKQIPDTLITMNGRHESFETGKALYKKLRQMDATEIRPKFYMGTNLGALDTITHMREGMFAAEVEEFEKSFGEGSKSTKMAEEIAAQVADFEAKRLAHWNKEIVYSEEIFSPKFSEPDELEQSKQCWYFKDRSKMYSLLKESITEFGFLPMTFPDEATLAFNKGFEYTGRNAKFKAGRLEDHFSKLNYLIQEAHVVMIRRLLLDQQANVYIVVSNAQSINRLFKYMEPNGDKLGNLYFNAGAILDLDPFIVPRELGEREPRLPPKMFCPLKVIKPARLIPGTGAIVDKDEVKRNTYGENRPKNPATSSGRSGYQEGYGGYQGGYGGNGGYGGYGGNYGGGGYGRGGRGGGGYGRGGRGGGGGNNYYRGGGYGYGGRDY